MDGSPSLNQKPPSILRDLREVVLTNLCVLAFREAVPDLRRLGGLYLAFGLFCTWLAGVGRYWDNERADVWQYLGLGSVAYVFAMSAVIWLLLYPLKPRHWNYRNVLIFVCMTAPPALLYAIPVERFMTLQSAQTVNVWFLAVVAGWRVALLFRFLKRSAGLFGGELIVSSLLPITLIVTALTFLNLEHVVFNIMSGIAPAQQTANDASYGVLILITAGSAMLLPFLAIGYLVLVWLYYSGARTR